MCGAAKLAAPIITRSVKGSVNHVRDPARIPVDEQKIRSVANPHISGRRGEKSKSSPVAPIIIVRQENVRKHRSDDPAAIAVAARIMEHRSANAMVARRPMSRLINRPVRNGLNRRTPGVRLAWPVRDGLNRRTPVVRPARTVRAIRLNRLDGRPLMARPVPVPRRPPLLLLMMAGPILLLVRSVCVTAIVLLLRRCSGGNQQGDRGDGTKKRLHLRSPGLSRTTTRSAGQDCSIAVSRLAGGQ